MTHSTHSLRHAGTALAAVLAIASTPSRAQDAAAPIQPAPEPVIVVPDIPVAAAPEPTPEPTVVLPAEPQEAPPPPETRAATPQAEPAPAPVAQPRAQATTPVRRAAPATAPRTETEQAKPVDEASAAPPVDAIAPIAAAPVSPVASERPPVAGADDPGILALVLGGLAFLVLAIWGFVAIGRRKPVRRYVSESAAAQPVPVAPNRSISGPSTVPAPVEPAAVPASQPARSVEPFAPRGPAVSGGLPHAGAAVALPRELPESYEEREALFRRMVDARPDRANPFTDRKARMKRARLIMQSIGRDFGEADPWIDLSQYPNNWPELASKRSAAA